MQGRYRELLQQRKASPSAIAIMEELFLNPYVTATRLSKRLKVSFSAVQSTIDWLVKAGVLREITGRQRNRIYCAEELLRAVEGKAAPSRTTQRRADQP